MIIAVLDYATGSVIIQDVPKELEDLDGDDICTNMRFNMSNTCYMIVDDEIDINIGIKGCSSKITLK